ncbi:CapA family protein [Acinetobacter suaedae]|uniref:CapA family protein n=1 Tax=Acinetobacter suaedae TaxID=2609668 RepID=A0A5P1US02_9GAMM|nr:CapA family protein [Acinetobacter sp. C16S1]QER38922.1 CapA family protein [Acinetobacter sp. C16S1]
MFYIKLDSDLNITSKYNADDRLKNKYCYEISNIFEDEVSELIKGRKNYTTQIIFEHCIDFKCGIRGSGFYLSQYLYFLNSYVDKEVLSNILLKNMSKKTIQSIIEFYSTLPSKYFSLFRPLSNEVNGLILEPFTDLRDNSLIDYIVHLSVLEERVFLIRYFLNGRVKYMVVGGQFEDREYDSLIPYLFENEISDLNIQEIYVENPVINFAGDTYFGERYTEKRRIKGEEDGLMKYGYCHSFSDINNFFGKDEFNIVNFEASFNTSQYSPFIKQKGYLLFAEPMETIKELKSVGFDCICLANNHTLDFGENSLTNTLNIFKENGFYVMGAGENQKEANKIIEINYNDKKIAIFNGYWRNHHYTKYGFYSLSNRAGVNLLSGVLFHQINLYKKKNPNAIVFCFCHWGRDFEPVHKYQKYLARRLIKSGADVIVGHGSHCIQNIEVYHNKHILYGIGNCVFNSDGEYNEKNVLPYGLLIKLDIKDLTMKLYPIFINNLKNFWKPRYVFEDEFVELKNFFEEGKDINFEKDCLGNFFKIKVGT